MHEIGEEDVMLGKLGSALSERTRTHASDPSGQRSLGSVSAAVAKAASAA